MDFSGDCSENVIGVLWVILFIYLFEIFSSFTASMMHSGTGSDASIKLYGGFSVFYHPSRKVDECQLGSMQVGTS